MVLVGTLLRAIVVCSTVAMASSAIVLCPVGTRVYSLSTWSGYWLDGVIMRCTGDSDDQVIPPEYNEEGGGGEDGNMCAGTEGVQSIEWSSSSSNDVLVHVRITCLDGKSTLVADGQLPEDLDTTGPWTDSCDDGEYVRGIEYEINDTDAFASFAYYITKIALMCSAAELDSICTDCTGGATLLSDEDQPEFCESPICTESECCEPDEPESVTTAIVIGIASTVVAAMIISGAAWSYNKFKVKKRGEEKEMKPVEALRAADLPPAYWG